MFGRQQERMAERDHHDTGAGDQAAEPQHRLGGQPVATYTAGQSFFEPDGSVHLFAENASTTQPAKILAVFVHRDGARLMVFH